MRPMPFLFSTSEQDHLLGAITASNIRRGAAQMCSVGYWIGKPHARQGYMGHALNALVGHAFNGLGLHRVEAACLPSNQASIALLRRCGFSEEGLARKYLNIAGKWQDHLLFARLPEGQLAAVLASRVAARYEVAHQLRARASTRHD